MTNIEIREHDDKVNVPEEMYRNPFQLVNDDNLSWDEKMTALKNWEADEKAALVADDENMACIAKPAVKGPSHEETLGNIQEAERLLKQLPHDAPDEKSFMECNILTALIAMNIDACIFYRNAASKSENSEFESKYHALEKLHSLAVVEMSMAIKKKGRVMSSEAEPLYQAHYCIFKDLCAIPYSSRDMAATAVIENAEQSCYDAINSTIGNEAISESTRHHLMCAIKLLDQRYAHLGALGKMSDAV